MVMNIYRKIAIAVLMLPTLAFSENKVSDKVVRDTTFNALDYVLQRPLGNPEFEDNRFGRHLFMTVEGGPEWMRGEVNNYGKLNQGYKAAVSVGDWITPISGWRLGISCGRHKGVYGSNPFFAGLSADYLMNIGNLLKGVNYHRNFDVLGVIGLDGQLLSRLKKQWWAYGAHIGFQARYYVVPSTFLFVEPRISIFSDKADGTATWHNYDWQAAVTLGVGYRFARPAFLDGGIDNSDFISQSFADNLFVGLKGSAYYFGDNTNGLKDNISKYVGGFIGKQFTPASALRLQVSGGRIRQDKQNWAISGIVDLDYMLNLNSAINGYDPDRKVELNAIVGASAFAQAKGPRRFSPGAHAALQGVWNLSSKFGLYLEPEIRVFDSKIMRRPIGHTYVPSAGVSLGLIYKNTRTEPRDMSELNRQEYEEFNTVRHKFISFGGGILGREKRWVNNSVLTLSYGSWFSPRSAWRMSLGVDYYKDHFPYYSAFIGADYIGSITSITNGYSPNRIFDLRAFAGITGGVARFRLNDVTRNEFIFGPEVGLQAAFRVARNLEIYVEPMAQLLRIPNYRHAVNPQWRLQAGITYRMGQNANERAQRTTANTESRYFIAASAGTGLLSETMFNRVVPFTANLSVGKWFNDVSGLQISNTYFSTSRFDSKIHVYNLGLEYLLNFTALINGGYRDDRFNIVGMLGAGMADSNLRGSNAVLSGTAGLRAGIRLWNNLEFTITPGATIMAHNSLPGITKHCPKAYATITGGLSYSF